MDFARQADELLRCGTFLQSRTEGRFIVDLFELDNLVVEVFYQRENEELISVMAHNTHEKLQRLYSGNLQPKLTLRRNDSRIENYAA